MHQQRLSLYEPTWQVLRVSLLKKNNKHGGWARKEGVKKNIALLRKYVGAKPTINKAYRVLNLLNAVLLGLPNFEDKSDRRMITQYRDEMQLLQSHLEKKQQQYIPPTVEEITRQLRELSQEDLFMMYENLFDRWFKHKTSNHRGELRWFLDLVEEIRPEVRTLIPQEEIA